MNINKNKILIIKIEIKKIITEIIKETNKNKIIIIIKIRMKKNKNIKLRIIKMKYFINFYKLYNILI